MLTKGNLKLWRI